MGPAAIAQFGSPFIKSKQGPGSCTAVIELL
ncbi:uncharacterized protein G2W53_024431 [Senna tora]|uniref:Uncharacterized protein n=1 Tax=Senna tora TaxID=362788 RepID=A0A834WGY3_9FABA|nr:uncharacterized protein G2W53_024431 [Senna tora]